TQKKKTKRQRKINIAQPWNSKTPVNNIMIFFETLIFPDTSKHQSDNKTLFKYAGGILIATDNLYRTFLIPLKH
ncbi:MAG: hypothetical protein ACXWQ4_15345, partial [Bdellovibrio sp.]